MGCCNMQLIAPEGCFPTSCVCSKTWKFFLRKKRLTRAKLDCRIRSWSWFWWYLSTVGVLRWAGNSALRAAVPRAECRGFLYSMPVLLLGLGLLGSSWKNPVVVKDVRFLLTYYGPANQSSSEKRNKSNGIIETVGIKISALRKVNNQMKT